jgi:hypothetical protein
LTTACGSDRVAAELVDIPVRRLRALTAESADGSSPSKT